MGSVERDVRYALANDAHSLVIFVMGAGGTDHFAMCVYCREFVSGLGKVVREILGCVKITYVNRIYYHDTIIQFTRTITRPNHICYSRYYRRFGE